jgi:hypothetical protein
MAKHYLRETGTDFILDTGINIGTVPMQAIYYKKPTGVTGTWSASLYSSQSDLGGVIGTYLLKHTLTYNDLDVSGTWKFNAFVAAVDGTWYGETVTLNIYDKYE